MTELLPTLIFSLTVATAATALVFLIGVPLAYGFARTRFIGKTLVEAAITIPLVLPPTVVGYFLLVLFGRNGWIGSFVFRATGYTIVFRPEAAILAAAIVSLPLLYLPAKAAFAEVDRELEDVAKLMGATGLQTFWHVSLPLARGGIASGLMLTFARSLGELGATIMVLGSSPVLRHLSDHPITTLPIWIFTNWESGEMPHAAAAVWALTVVSLVVILLYNRWPLTARQASA
jgi:molybdate transport system permease protein